MDNLANRYRVLGKLGEGGMGTVYRVADRLDGDRELALKTIRMADGVTPAARLRFKEEFHAMARLKHPNTLEVFDFGELDAENLYLTMELVPGTELSARIGGRPMPLDEVYALLIQLLKALGFIHSRLYVHRDIKAENIRVTPEGTLKLMDFGLMGQLGMPGNGQVTGTPGYLAPEVARGGIIDGTSDLYSVGCLAYEMLTGKLPFEGTLIEVVRAHVSTPPVPPSQKRELPTALERIVLRLLEKDPRRRYRSAAEVIDDLVPLSGLAIARESADQRQSYLSTSVLVGREQELDALSGALESAIAGQPRAIVVGAPAGVGKSRLVTELLLKAKLSGVLVLHGRCRETGMAPYQAIAEALRPALAHGTEEEGERYASAVAKLFPEFCEDAPALEDPQALRETVVEWLSAVSARVPLLLLLDDVHWADPQTLDTYNHIVRRLSDQRLLCLATLRSDEVPPGAAAWYTVDEGASQLLKLGPLTPEHQSVLLKAMLGPIHLGDAFAQALYEATGGNPFFLTEVVRALMDDRLLQRRGAEWHFPGDPSVLAPLGSMEATLARRLSKLSEAGHAVVNAASVISNQQDLGMICAALDLPEEAILDALDELIERQFMQRSETGYSFPHARVREIVYARLKPEERRQLHRRAGEYLESLYWEPQPVLHTLAPHFVQAGVHDKAYHYAERAGAQAD
ncbi:MAG TPA: protein kinase, partial [Oscillatoriaceae cyanobacterium]